MDLYFLDVAGNLFVVPDAPEGYSPVGAKRLSPPPSTDHRWIEGKWRKPSPSPLVVPDCVTMRQARLAMLGAGLLSKVQIAIEALPEPDRSTAQIEWEYATELKRDHPLITALGEGLSMSSEQVDSLFIQAASIA